MNSVRDCNVQSRIDIGMSSCYNKGNDMKDHIVYHNAKGGIGVVKMEYETWIKMYRSERKYNLHKRLEMLFNLEDELTEMLKDWDGNDISVTLSNGWEFINDGNGRDCITTIKDHSGNGESDMVMFASLIMGNEEYGWVDLDPNAWSITTEAILDDDYNFLYLELKIQCTDWAS